MTIFGMLLAIVLSFTHSQDSNDVPIIDLGYAKYQGVFDSVNNITNYLGMRYAAPLLATCVSGLLKPPPTTMVLSSKLTRHLRSVSKLWSGFLILSRRSTK
ncbi:hypothetical protein BDP27DRAFT_420025 [Rhodocollybia butyracea]|uniref:Uncharacterized protein n=1 Tax=Rhodocollybia butyracea TaxID=206335 RepID=A0A9P5TYH0_9AGAR|nr:hypothetical protein BDP27DRAFT_420025 [Rhodocollybia butyracea]